MMAALVYIPKDRNIITVGPNTKVSDILKFK